MDSENTVSLVKELEKMNSANSKNNYRLAWTNLVVSIVLLTALFNKSLSPTSGPTNAIILSILFAFAVLLMLSSFHNISNNITKKRLSIMIKAILDLEKSK